MNIEGLVYSFLIINGKHFLPVSKENNIPFVYFQYMHKILMYIEGREKKILKIVTIFNRAQLIIKSILGENRIICYFS